MPEEKQAENQQLGINYYYETRILGYLNKANHYRDERRFEEAIANYTKAIALEQNVAYYVLRANCYKECEQYKKAIADYNIAINLEPNPYYLMCREDCYKKLNQKRNNDSDTKDNVDTNLVLKPSKIKGYGRVMDF